MDQSRNVTRQKRTSELGRSGTTITGGILSGEEYNYELVGAYGLQKYDIMRRSDPVVHAALEVIKLPIKGAIFDIEPADDSDEEKRRAEEVKNDLMDRNVDFTQFMSEILTMFDFGFSIFEKVYEPYRYKGKLLWGIAKFGWRKQTTIRKWETKDAKPGIIQQLDRGEVSIPRSKLMVFTHKKEGENHEGISVLRSAYKHWDMKDALELVNAIALEKHGIGVVDLGIPAGASEADIAKAIESARQLRGNEEGYIKHPVGWEVKFLDMQASSLKDILPTLYYHRGQILLSVLAQFLDLGQTGTGGSRAVSEDQTKLFESSLDAAAKVITGVIQKEYIKEWVDINYSDVSRGYPRLVYSKIGDENISEISQAIERFTKSGVYHADAETEKRIRKMIHMPEMGDDIIEQYTNKDDTSDTDAVEAPAKPEDGKTPLKEDEKKGKAKELTASEAVENARRAKKILIEAVDREYSQPTPA